MLLINILHQLIVKGLVQNLLMITPPSSFEMESQIRSKYLSLDEDLKEMVEIASYGII